MRAHECYCQALIICSCRFGHEIRASFDAQVAPHFAPEGIRQFYKYIDAAAFETGLREDRHAFGCSYSIFSRAVSLILRLQQAIIM